MRPSVRSIVFDDAVRAFVDAYCRQYGIASYAVDVEATWLGAFAQTSLVGVGAYTDLLEKRFIRDFYVVDGIVGVRAAVVLWAELRSRGVPIVGSVTSRNRPMLRFLAKRGARVESYHLSML